MKTLKKSVEAAYISVYGAPLTRTATRAVANVVSKACAGYFSTIHYTKDTGNTVLLDQCVYTELMKCDTEVALSYILYSLAKHLSMETDNAYTYDFIYDVFRSRREKPK